MLYTKAIGASKESLILSIFSLTDQDMIDQLKAVSVYLPLKIHYDPKYSKNLKNIFLPPVELKAKSKCRLMHHKILIIDKNLVFIGSSNLTPSSLLYHNNIVLGIHSPPLAEWLSLHIEEESVSFTTFCKEALLSVYLMPDKKKEALTHLIKEIDQAKSSIQVALFSLTHPEIIGAFERAIARGVLVSILIDKTAMHSKIAHLPLSEYRGMELMHQKCCLIDNQTVILGSVNWTNAGFKYNKDILLIIKNLNTKELKEFRKAIK
jgi:phosphatidylserine/phosphatidylglycerophosphate/cardiolipin synthase-like enzyme